MPLIRRLKEALEKVKHIDAFDDDGVEAHYLIEQILLLMHEKSSGIFKLLSQPSFIAVFQTVQVLELGTDAEIFHQGDVSDGYYVIIEGSVSIFKYKSSQHAAVKFCKQKSQKTLATTNLRSRLTSLGPGACFGDLDLIPNSSYRSVRAATAITDCPTSLIFFPLNTYLEYLYPLYAAELEINARQLYLLKLPLFELWPAHLLNKLAKNLLPKNKVPAGHCITNVGEQISCVFFIIHGEIKVSLAFSYDNDENTSKMMGGSQKNKASQWMRQECMLKDVPQMDVAILGPQEIYGLCEMMHGSFLSYRTARCVTEVETWVIRFEDFLPIIHSDSQILEIFNASFKIA